MNNLPVITWDDIFDARESANELLPGEARKSESALRRLRTLFGESLMDCSPILLQILFNQAPWTYRWITWLDEALARLAHAEGYSAVLNRLSHPDAFDEALTVFQVAERLNAVCLDVKFERRVKIGENTKIPDLHIYDPESRAQLFAEISVLYSADVNVEAGRALERLHYGLISLEGDDLAVCGRIYAPKTETELNAVVDRLLWEAMEVKRDITFREVNIETFVEFAIAPESQKNLVDDWARARGWQPDTYGISSQPTDPLVVIPTRASARFGR